MSVAKKNESSKGNASETAKLPESAPNPEYVDEKKATDEKRAKVEKGVVPVSHENTNGSGVQETSSAEVLNFIATCGDGLRELTPSERAYVEKLREEEGCRSTRTSETSSKK